LNVKDFGKTDFFKVSPLTKKAMCGILSLAERGMCKMAKWLCVGGCIQAVGTVLLTRLGLITPSPVQQFIAGLMLLGTAAALAIMER
jgi:hypothetical protein